MRLHLEDWQAGAEEPGVLASLREVSIRLGWHTKEPPCFQNERTPMVVVVGQHGLSRLYTRSLVDDGLVMDEMSALVASYNNAPRTGKYYVRSPLGGEWVCEIFDCAYGVGVLCVRTYL
jgi:hypothetical protein